MEEIKEIDWQGGNPAGSISFANNSYVVRFNKGPNKTFSGKLEKIYVSYTNTRT